MAKPDFSPEENPPRNHFFVARTSLAGILSCPCSEEKPPSLHPQQKAKKQAQHYGIRLQAPLLPGQEVLGGGLPDLPALAGRARASLGTSTSPKFLSRITLTLAVASALSNCTSHNKIPGSNTLALLGEIAVLFPAIGL